MSQAVQNLLNYFYRAIHFFIDLIKRFLGIADGEDVSE